MTITINEKLNFPGSYSERPYVRVRIQTQVRQTTPNLTLIAVCNSTTSCSQILSRLTPLQSLEVPILSISTIKAYSCTIFINWFHTYTAFLIPFSIYFYNIFYEPLECSHLWLPSSSKMKIVLNMLSKLFYHSSPHPVNHSCLAPYVPNMYMPRCTQNTWSLSWPQSCLHNLKAHHPGIILSDGILSFLIASIYKQDTFKEHLLCDKHC